MKQVHRTGSRVRKLSKVGEKKEWGKPKSALIVSSVQRTRLRRQAGLKHFQGHPSTAGRSILHQLFTLL